jgi:hypothetical protein
MVTRAATRSLVRRRVACALALMCWAGAGTPASSQDWPDGPVTALDGRVTVGAEVTVTAAPDDLGYFNFADYEHSTLRLVRLGLTSVFRATDRLSFLLEMRAEGDSADGHWIGAPYAAYVRVRPWVTRDFEVRAGRIPTAFGSFSYRSYGSGNPLIGYPLAYQYLTSLRADALPASADELASMRARGWLTGYSIGDPSLETGVPLVNIFRYDAGVMARAGLPADRGDVSLSVTTGTLSHPRGDDNGAPQVAARLRLQPAVGLVLGASIAGGSFLTGSVRDVLPAEAARESSHQRALGADVEYSRDYWLVRSELVASRWTLPSVSAPHIDSPLWGSSWLVEGRYKLRPGLYAAARFDRLFFSRIDTSTGRIPWEADVWRVEGGIGYSLRRNVLVKGTVQHNRRDGGRIERATLAAAQVSLWF